jgi:hypothetical protein
VSLEGWIFMVGLRVFDVGALIAWLVWFYRLREDDDDGHDGGGDDPRGDRPPEPKPPLPDADPWPRRRRDHTGDRAPDGPGRRRAPRPARLPERAGARGGRAPQPARLPEPAGARRQ